MSSGTAEDSDPLRISAIIERARKLGTDSSAIEIKSAVEKLPRTTGETLSAFANGSGGTLILGLDEREDFLPAHGFEAELDVESTQATSYSS